MLYKVFISFLLLGFTAGLECYVGGLDNHNEFEPQETMTLPNYYACIRYDMVLGPQGGSSATTEFSGLRFTLGCTCDKLDDACSYLAKENLPAGSSDIISCKAKCCNTDRCNGAKLSDIKHYNRADVMFTNKTIICVALAALASFLVGQY